MTTPEGRPRRRLGPLFVPVTKRDFFEDIPLYGRPEFRGGMLSSDRQITEAERMDTETKEITKTPNTETKDVEVESGTRPACVDPKCPYAGSWHVHEGR